MKRGLVSFHTKHILGKRLHMYQMNHLKNINTKFPKRCDKIKYVAF